MSKRFIAKLILVMLLFSVLLPSQVWGAAVSNLTVYSSNNIVNYQTTVSIYFNTVNSLVGGQDTITVRFPSAYQIDATLNKNDITINKQIPTAVYVNGNIITITTPANINVLAGQQVELIIAGGKIKNPVIAGSYQLYLATSRDLTELPSSTITISDYEYTDGISKPTVTATTTAASNALTYRIGFKLPASGTLSPGDKISIIFPIDVQVPSIINPSYISLNGKALINGQVTVSGKIVTITVPTGMYIAPYGSMEVLINPGASLLYQGNGSSNTLLVYTSVNTRVVQSQNYVPNDNTTNPQNPSGAGNIFVSLNPDGAEIQAGYTITIKPNVLSSLGTKLDSLVLTFPERTSLPENIDPGLIKVNGLQAKDAMVNLNNKRELIFLLPTSVYTDQTITITIDGGAKIYNPTTGVYQLHIGTIKNSNSFSSDGYVVKAQSTTPSTPVNPPQNNNDNPKQGKKIILQIDNKTAYVDGVAQTLLAPPTIIDSSTMVPLRFIADSLGATIDYNSIGQYAVIQYGNKEMTLWVNSTLAKVDGLFVYLQTPATLRNDSILVPVRFFTENFGADLDWDDATMTFTITIGEGSNTNTPPASNNSSNKPYPIGYMVTVGYGTSAVNLRSSPDETANNIIGKLYPGESLEITGVQGNWYKVKLNTGGEAWVANWVVEVSQG